MLVAGQRDPGMQDMVDYFDRLPAKHKDWESWTPEQRFSVLKKAEREVIREQVEMCSEQFEYAARNYFWITRKSGEDMLFTLWESQWLVLQKYYELKRKGRAQKIMVLKARQLGLTVLCEAMVAWKTMFTPNTKGLVVSVVKPDSADMFAIMLHIYDHMPWWLKPELASREEKDGIWFDRRDPEMRAKKPGMNSRVYVQASNQLAGVGQGKSLRAIHVSEYTDYLQSDFEEIIEGDLLAAIADNPEAFCILESTGRGAGTYSHDLWKGCVKRGERAEFTPLFLPWFFESTRVAAPPSGWHVARQENIMRDKVKAEWVRCSKCSQYQAAALHGESRLGTVCSACDEGILENVTLSDAQLYWKQIRRENAEDKGKESVKKHHMEMSTSAEESWQLSGMSVFDEASQEMVQNTIRDPSLVAGVKVGFIDSYRRFHGLKGERGCWIDGCHEDHRFSDENFTIWEDPLEGYLYSAGVDISEGLGQDDSVIFVNKIGRFGGPDEQVAVFRANNIEPYDLAFYCDAIGRMYNEALMCVEYNIFTTTGDRLRINFEYPNLFRWLNLENVNPVTNKWHWYTDYKHKPLLWQTARHWLKSGNWIIHDPVFLSEMKTFQKDEDDSRSASHDRGAHDDTLMAGMISLYCSHAMEADPTGRIPVQARQQPSEPARYRMWCQSCKFGQEMGEDGNYPWGVSNPEDEFRCPACGSIHLRSLPLESPDQRNVDYEQMMGMLQKGKDRQAESVLDQIGSYPSSISKCPGCGAPCSSKNPICSCGTKVASLPSSIPFSGQRRGNEPNTDFY